MNIYNYRSASSQHEQELISSLNSTNIAFLISYLSEKEYTDWQEDFFLKLSEIQKYVKATPAQRLKNKAWNKSTEDKCLLTFASIQYAHAAYSFLENIDVFLLGIDRQALSYRNMTVLAGDALLDIYYPPVLKDSRSYYGPLAYWPFDDYQNPFWS